MATKSRFASLLALMDPSQVAELGIVQGALQEDPACLDRPSDKKKDEEKQDA